MAARQATRSGDPSVLNACLPGGRGSTVSLAHSRALPAPDGELPRPVLSVSPDPCKLVTLLSSGQSWLLVDLGPRLSEGHHPVPFSFVHRHGTFPGICPLLPRSSVVRTDTKATPRRSLGTRPPPPRRGLWDGQAESCPPVWGPFWGGLCQEELMGGRGRGPRGAGRQVLRQKDNHPSSGPGSSVPEISENALEPTENLELAV